MKVGSVALKAVLAQASDPELQGWAFQMLWGTSFVERLKQLQMLQALAEDGSPAMTNRETMQARLELRQTRVVRRDCRHGRLQAAPWLPRGPLRPTA